MKDKPNKQLSFDGNRFRPEKIQDALTSGLGIQNVIVRSFVFKDMVSICAFYTDPIDIDPAAAQLELMELLEPDLIPTNYYRLLEFPKLPGGKVDQTALVPPEGDWQQFYDEAISEIPLIGKGRTAEVFRLGERKAIKLFRENYPLFLIANECRNGRTVRDLGLPGTETFSMVRFRGCYGIMMEFCAGKTFEQALEDDFDSYKELTERYIQSVRTMHSIHDKNRELRNAKKTLCDFTSQVIGVFDKEQEVLIRKVLEHIPDRDTLIQTDCHIGNCFLVGDKTKFFDFAYMGHGHPIFDLSAMYAHMIFWPEHDKRGKLSVEQCRKVFNLFLSKYLGTQDKNRLENAERQLHFMRILMTVFAAALAPGMYSEQMIKDANLQLHEDAEWFVQQDLIE